jgi:hypothetical protein
MDQREVDKLLTPRMPALRMIPIAFSVSVLTYIGVAWYLTRVLAWEPLVEMPFAITAGIATAQLLVIVLGYLASRSIRSGAAEAATERGPAGSAERAAAFMDRYRQSIVVASGMREVAAVFGFLLSLLTGELLWVVFLGGASLFSMLVHWPRREAVEEWLSQQGLRA